MDPLIRILLAEDDAVIADSVRAALFQSGYLVDYAKTGTDAAHMLSCAPYDTAVLDLGLPEMDGLDVLKQARAQKNRVPVLILTARNTLDDRVDGLDAGADDYLAKPFTLRELEARVRALVRRKCYATETELCLANLRFDANGRRVYAHDLPVTLSAREMDVLELLMMHAGRVVSKAKLIAHLCRWDEQITGNAIEAYISRLRKKLQNAGVQLQTVHGLGYLIEALNGPPPES